MGSKIQQTMDELHNDIAVLNAEIKRLKQVCDDYAKIVASMYRDMRELEKKK